MQNMQIIISNKKKLSKLPAILAVSKNRSYTNDSLSNKHLNARVSIEAALFAC